MNCFEKLARKTVHAGLKLVSPLLPYRAPKTADYPAAAAALKGAGEKVLIVTGKKVRARGLCDPLLSALENAGMGWENKGCRGTKVPRHCEISA